MWHQFQHQPAQKFQNSSNFDALHQMDRLLTSLVSVWDHFQHQPRVFVALLSTALFMVSSLSPYGVRTRDRSVRSSLISSRPLFDSRHLSYSSNMQRNKIILGWWCYRKRMKFFFVQPQASNFDILTWLVNESSWPVHYNFSNFRLENTKAEKWHFFLCTT